MIANNTLNSPESIQEMIYSKFKLLSNEKMQEVYDFISYLNNQEEWEATKELDNSEILEQIRQGLDELKRGEFVKFNEIRKNV